MIRGNKLGTSSAASRIRALPRSVLAILRRPERCEDILQETFRLVFEANRKTPIAHPKSWPSLLA